MKTKVLLLFAVAGLVVASAKTYSIELFQPALLGTTQLAPGQYNVDIKDQKAVISKGKMHCEAPVNVKTMDQKYNTTTVRFFNGDGKMHIQEIHIGGTATNLVFTE